MWVIRVELDVNNAVNALSTMDHATGLAPAAARPPVAAEDGATLLEHAVRYTEERRWDVLPGTWLETREGGALHCSCAVPACGAPGAHATRRDWFAYATGSTTTARLLWSKEPRAAILLPAGRTFDVLDVPESAGCLALARCERTGVTLGPVATTPDGRMQFFVRPGGAARTPELLLRFGWSPGGLDLSGRGEGTYVVAPPTRMGTRGCAHWIRRPTRANRWLPDAQELIPALAYACARES